MHGWDLKCSGVGRSCQPVVAAYVGSGCSCPAGRIEFASNFK